MKNTNLLYFIFVSGILLFLSACEKNAPIYIDQDQSNHDLSTFENQNTTNDGQNSDNKKIFIIGDSTVHNTTTYDGVRVHYGWGDLLSKYMKNPENIYNLAQPGASTRSYKERNELEGDGWFHNWYQTKNIIENSDLSNGGYLFIQFGHNDKSDSYDVGDTGTLPGRGGSYYVHLKSYIQAARSYNLTPVLITPVERMIKNQGEELVYSHKTSLGGYANTVKMLAQDTGTLLLDLQQISWEKFNQYSDTKALQETFGYDDVEHFSYDGANQVASWVRDLICNSGDDVLCGEFIEY